MRRLVWGLLLSLIIIPVYSQRVQLKFDHLTVSQGLSQNSVLSIAEDKHGFMWFATLDGLNKFDGYEVVRYYQDSTGTGLPDNVITCVYATPDSLHQLWIGTADHGLCMYDPVFDKFKVYEHHGDNSLISNNVTCLAGDSRVLWVGTEHGLCSFDVSAGKWKNIDLHGSGLKIGRVNTLRLDLGGNLWVGTPEGLYKIDTASLRTNFYDQDKGLPANNISAIAMSPAGSIWVGTDNGLVMYDGLNDSFVVYSGLDDLPDREVNALLFDHQGILWIGTENSGLVRYDFENNELDVYTHDPTDPHSLSVNTVLSIYEDSHHILWVGTSLGGVDKWNRAAQSLLVFRHNPYNPHSLSSNLVRTIYQDKDGVIWIGTVDKGLNKWVEEAKKFVHVLHKLRDPYSIPQNHIRAIYQDSQDRFWIGTADSGLAIIDPHTLRVKKLFVHTSDPASISCDKIWKITEDHGHRLIIATYGGGINILDNPQYKFKKITKQRGLSSDSCTTVFVDSKNNIWVGTIDGLNLIDPDGKIKVFKYIGSPTSICNNRIYDIVQDRNGQIWIGTKGGLAHYLGNGKFENFTVRNSDLPNNVIMGILEDSKNNLWLTTNRGLCKFNPQTGKVKVYDVRDGLQSNEFLVGSVFKTKDGMFLIGGINGFNAFYPEKIRVNHNIPYVVLTGFMVSNQPFRTDTNITEKKFIVLKHDQNDLTFSFVAIDYILPEKNQYAYKLEPYDKDWIYAKCQRNARYTNLPPGRYVFRVKGSNNDGIWNEQGTQVNIFIKPAFWQTLWFKVLMVILVLGSVAFGFWLRMRILQKQKEYLEAEVARQTKEIREKNEEIMRQNQILIQQKEEIIAQRDEIQRQKEIAVAQRDLIAKQKREIEDSIEYAKNIQTAVLPDQKLLKSLFDEFFILFLPRDIVSGDFYWAAEKNGLLIAVAADCTGHGVPGAFMSMLGISFLNKIVNEKGITAPDQILERLRLNVINALKESVEGERKDGMDITVVTIDRKRQVLEFSGAHNPLYLVRDEELVEYKADKMPVAIYDYMEPFRKETIEYTEGDMIYMFSDGYADQFGGPKSKKFKYKNLKKLFLKIHKMAMDEQKAYLEQTLERWMSYPDPLTGADRHFQVDDILIFGIRL